MHIVATKEPIVIPYAYETPEGVKRSFDARPPKMFEGLDRLLSVMAWGK